LSDLRGPAGAHYAAYKEWRWGDFHVKLLAILCDRHRISLDIGAHTGAYTYFLRHHSARCLAFEPNPEMADRLRDRFSVGVEVRAVAVSDKSGLARLRIPKDALGRATIEPSNELADFSGIEVPIVCLDDVVKDNVGFIKIDVEGHELAVLRGADKIIRRDMPNIITELEERYCAGIVRTAFRHLNERGYHGWFLFGGNVISTADFVPSVHQQLGPRTQSYRPYAWNFIFSPDPDMGTKLKFRVATPALHLDVLGCPPERSRVHPTFDQHTANRACF
jgi:FkbM family methyltransferase